MSNTNLKYPTANEAAIIRQSLASLLATPKNGLFFLEGYGSNCQRLLFEQNDNVFASLMSYFVAEAIQDWEPRIRLVNVTFENVQESQVNVVITYRIKRNDVIDSFQYPFYKEIN